MVRDYECFQLYIELIRSKPSPWTRFVRRLAPHCSPHLKPHDSWLPCHVVGVAPTGITRKFTYDARRQLVDYCRANVATNDVAGNFSVTLVDVLDTFIVMSDVVGFHKAVRNVIDWVSFDVNTKPQVFETNIRVLGGLLSAHLLASKPSQAFYIPWYRNELLDLAHDLGKRLLPAFKTPTGIPYARVSSTIPQMKVNLTLVG